jgi:hypothetical protein
MARSRSKPQSNKNETTSTQGEKKMPDGLSMEEIAGLLAGSRQKGAGTEVLQDFAASDEAGIEVDLSTGPLAGKEPGQAYTTLNNARKRTVTQPDGSTTLANPEFNKIRVIKRNVADKGQPDDYRVFLINTDKVNV